MSILELRTEGFGDAIKKAKAVYDYAKGNRHDTLIDLQPATVDDINSNDEVSNIVKSCKHNNAECSVEVDRYSQKLKVTLGASKVPADIADRVVPGGDLYKKLTGYENGKIEIIFDAPDLPDAPDESGNFTVPDAKESVMTPTPTPYKFTPAKSSRDIVLTLKTDDLYPIDEDTAGLTLSYPIGFEDHLEVNINGKRYGYKPKEDSQYTSMELADKVAKMRTYSSGKALQFLKKNAVGTPITTESNNPFKSHHICSGCGNTLDKCTCEVDEEDLDEDFSGSSTQISNVGQHKSSCLDLIEEDDDIPYRAIDIGEGDVIDGGDGPCRVDDIEMRQNSMVFTCTRLSDNYSPLIYEYDDHDEVIRVED